MKKYLLALSISISMLLLVKSPVLFAAPIYWDPASGGNGHWYDWVDIDLSWDDAKVYAENLGGYLATMTSQSENDFVWTGLAQDVHCPWLGGFQPPGTAEPDTGWQWVTGETWNFTNWGLNQPDDAHGGQDYLVFYSGGTWDDYDVPGGVTSTFIVEYESNPVPIPSAVWLLASGLIAFAGIRNRRKFRKA